MLSPSALLSFYLPLSATSRSCPLALSFSLSCRSLLWVPKIAMGASNTWLGFVVTPANQLERMAPAKHELVILVLQGMVSNQSFTKTELMSAMRRLQLATTSFPFTKPFSQAFWQRKGPDVPALLTQEAGSLIRFDCWFDYQVLLDQHPLDFSKTENLSGVLPSNAGYLGAHQVVAQPRCNQG